MGGCCGCCRRKPPERQPLLSSHRYQSPSKDRLTFGRGGARYYTNPPPVTSTQRESPRDRRGYVTISPGSSLRPETASPSRPDTASSPAQPPKGSPVKKEYYRGRMSRVEAEQVLLNSQRFDGLFVIRESGAPLPSEGPTYILSLCHNEKVHHLEINRREDGKYTLIEIPGSPAFKSVEKLINHYQRKHIDLEGGGSVQLKYFLPHER